MKAKGQYFCDVCLFVHVKPQLLWPMVRWLTRSVKCFSSFLFCLNLVKYPWNMSEKPATEYTAMQEEAEAGGPPPYGMQPGYPMAQPGYPQPVMAQPMVQQQTNTTVVVTQPSQVVLQQGMRDWSSGLCGCFEDFYSCKWSVHRITGGPTRSKTLHSLSLLKSTIS